MNVPTMIVGIRYTITPAPPGTVKPTISVIKIAEIIENNTAIAVDIVVNEDSSIERNSLKLLIQTTFQTFQVIRR